MGRASRLLRAADTKRGNCPADIVAPLPVCECLPSRTRMPTRLGVKRLGEDPAMAAQPRRQRPRGESEKNSADLAAG